MPFVKSPCDLDARKSFPNAPDYELKLNSGLIVHLAAVSGEGKIDVGITYTDVHQVQQCRTTPRFVALLLSQERSHKKTRSSLSVYWEWSAHTSLPPTSWARRC